MPSTDCRLYSFHRYQLLFSQLGLLLPGQIISSYANKGAFLRPSQMFAKGSLIYVLEIYFGDYYDGALHYYSIIVSIVIMSLCHYVIVIWGPHFIVKFCPERVAE